MSTARRKWLIGHPESADQVDGMGVSLDLTERNRGSSSLHARSHMLSHPGADLNWPTSMNSSGLGNGEFRQVRDEDIESITMSLRSSGCWKPRHYIYSGTYKACVRVRGAIVVVKVFASKFALVRNTTATALALVFLALPPVREFVLIIVPPPSFRTHAPSSAHLPSLFSRCSPQNTLLALLPLTPTSHTRS